MPMHFDKEMINPNIARTIRFTPIIYEWLTQVKEREKLSFNQVVLQCCKNCMEEDRRGEETGLPEGKDKSVEAATNLTAMRGTEELF